MSEDIITLSSSLSAIAADAPASGAASAPVAALHAEDMLARAETAAQLLKALSHEGRLMILCHLAAGEKSVTELERLLGQRQAAVSQQLARLRGEGLVQTRRDGKAIYYSIGDARALRVVGLLYEMFCAPDCKA